MGIIAKPEQDQGPATWDMSSSGGTVFAYAEALPYDWWDRGVTAGLVGFTSANGGQEAWGDMQFMLGLYAAKSGIDLRPLCVGTTTSLAKCQTLVNALRNAGSDSRYIAAQWDAITSSANPSAYLYHAMRLLRTRGFSPPRALTIAACFDHALNCGIDGQYGLQWVLQQIPTSVTDETQFLRALTAQRLPILGLNGYNDPPINGQRRAEIISKILDAGCLDLKNCDAAVRLALNYVLQ